MTKNSNKKRKACSPPIISSSSCTNFSTQSIEENKKEFDLLLHELNEIKKEENVLLEEEQNWRELKKK